MAKQILQWQTWLYGLIAAAIGGGASAVVSTLTASAIAPDKFNVTTQLHNFLLLAGVTFAVSGFLQAMGYLAKSPLPPLETTTVTEAKLLPTADGGLKTTTVSKTTETTAAN